MARAMLFELPKLNRLQPTLQSTLLKLVEESGELARVVAQLPMPLAGCHESVKLTEGDRAIIGLITSELLDVAQTCVSMIFVLEENNNIDISSLFVQHSAKLYCKKYIAEAQVDCGVFNAEDGGKTMYFPRLNIERVSLVSTMLKIQEEMGELTQFLGKAGGASGEKRLLPDDAIMVNMVLELLDVAQCCATMLYILAERFAVDVSDAVKLHREKLLKKGYLA